MMVYSYSRIGCFENCPRQYKFRYIEKPKIDKPQGVEAFMGSMVHEALEILFRLVQQGKVLTLDELLNKYKALWDEKLPANLKIVKKDMTAEDYFNLGRKCLTDFYDRDYPFDQEITLGLERRVSIILDDEAMYKMTGFIDRLTRDGTGRLRIQDYKTGRTLPTQPDIEADRQLALYQIAVEEMWPDNNGIELVWHYMQFNTTLISHRRGKQLEKLKQDYISKIKRVEAAVELGSYPTNETNLCDWCEYCELCPAKGGTGVPEDSVQPELQPISEDRLKELVDEYVTLDSEKKSRESRLKEIRSILVQYGESGSGKLLKGTGPKGVMVILDKSAKLPTKAADAEAFNKITELVETEGLYRPYSQLDITQLQKAMEDGDLPDRLIDRLKPFQLTGVRETVRIKKVT